MREQDAPLRDRHDGGMIVSAHQPAFLPWLGYFDRIARSDVFVFLDGIQFEKNSFINRNRIKTKRGPLWLTIPVNHKGHTSSTMVATTIAGDNSWRRKQLCSISQAYSRAPYFGSVFPKLESLYKIEGATLADTCFSQLQFWLSELSITTRIVRMSDLELSERKSDLVLEICQKLGATNYISGALGRDYLELAQFQAASVGVTFQDYAHPEYRQLHGDFVPNLSIVDAWMNLGPETAALFAPKA